MKSGVSLETFWAIKKHWNNKFYYTVASCWLFLYDLYYDERIHEHHVLFPIGSLVYKCPLFSDPYFILSCLFGVG
jgi:hypothetical protein